MGYLKGEKEDNNEMKTEKQVLKMNNERITVPEILFNPSDIGITQAGIAESVIPSINSCHSDIQGMLYSNILLMGGNTLFPNFRERFETEVRKLAPDMFPVRVLTPDDPITVAWSGGSKFCCDPNYHRFVVTKSQYEEFGFELCKRKFL